MNLNQETQICWICFGTDDDDDPTRTWVRPCKCKGSGKWVHEPCLFTWIDEKMRQNGTSKISCPQCKTEYIIIAPETNAVTSFVQMIDRAVNRACPVFTAGVTVIVLYWSASTYGAFTYMQIYGEEKGLEMLDSCDLNTLLVLLPLIPGALIMLRLVPWEEYVLNALRSFSRYPVLRRILPSLKYNEVLGDRVYIMPPPSTSVSSTRIFVGALVLPSIAQVFGHVFFQNEKSCLKRFLLGGLSFVIIKGMLKMYYRHKTYIQTCQRRIKNHDEVISFRKTSINSTTKPSPLEPDPQFNSSPHSNTSSPTLSSPPHGTDSVPSPLQLSGLSEGQPSSTQQSSSSSIHRANDSRS